MPRQKLRKTSTDLARIALAIGLTLLAFQTGIAGEKVALTLKNGDRLSGELTSENDTKVVLKTPLLGTLRIPKSDITKRETILPPAPTAGLEKQASKPPSPAPISPAPVPTPAVTVGKPVLTNSTPILTSWVPAWGQPFLTNWHGNIQLGLDLGFGTSDRQTFYFNGSASHSWNRLRNFADIHSAYGFVNQVQSANRVDGSLKTETDLGQGRRIYAYNQGGASADVIRQLNMEFHEGIGMGYKVLQRPKMTVNTEAGLQYQSFDYRLAPDRSFVSLRLGENLSWNLLDKLTLNQRLAVTPNVADFSEYHVRFDIGLSYPLFKRVTLNVNFIEEYESKPPRGVDHNDLQVQSTLGVSF